MSGESRLPSAVLAALGLAASQACGSTVGACLKVAACLEPGIETGDTDSGDSPGDSGVGPCLDIPEDTADSGGADSAKTVRLGADAAVVVRRLAAEGVLAPDIAQRLKEGK